MSDPLQILRERLAKGEISEEEYTRLQSILLASDTAPISKEDSLSTPKQTIAREIKPKKKATFWNSTFPIIIVLAVVGAVAKLYFRDADGQNLSKVIAGKWSCTLPEDIAENKHATYGMDISAPSENSHSGLTVKIEMPNGNNSVNVAFVGEYKVKSETALSLDYRLNRILVSAIQEGNELLIEAEPRYKSGKLEKVTVVNFTVNGEVGPTEFANDFAKEILVIPIVKSNPYKMVVWSFSDSDLSIDGVECKR